MIGVLLALVLLGCAPGRVQVEPVAFRPVGGSEPGPSVFLAFPVDARPPGDRLAGNVTRTTALPTLYYGDTQLSPGALDLVDRTLHDALRASGVTFVDDPAEADLVVQTWVLGHRGMRDVSDAHWVNTVTAGTAGLVGSFLYPVVLGAHAHLRIAIREPDGDLVGVRDVAHTAVRRRSLGRTRSMWYAYTFSPTKALFTEAFTELHGRIGEEAARLVHDATDGEITSGLAPEAPAQHFLAERWDRERLPGRHAGPRFSPVTGHDTERGEALGKLGFPLDTLGYELGVLDRAQVLVNVTLLGLPRFEEDADRIGIGTIDTVVAYFRGDLEGLFNAASGGLRGQVVRAGDFTVSLEGRTGVQIVLRDENDFVPRVAGVSARGEVIGSWRPGTITWFARGGAVHNAAIERFEEEPLLPGTRAVGAVGAEAMLGASAALAIEVVGSARVDDPSTVTVYPQLTLGLR